MHGGIRFGMNGRKFMVDEMDNFFFVTEEALHQNLTKRIKDFIEMKMFHC